MRAALGVFRRAIRHLNGNGYIYVWANLAFVLLSLPIITMPAAWAGLSRLTYHAIREPNADWDEFIGGIKEWLVRGVVLALVNATILMLNGFNLLLHPGSTLGDWALRAFWIGFLVVWFSIQFYMYPLYYAMETPTLRGAFRNALIMVIFNPVYTLTLTALLLIVWSFSTILFASWGLLTVSFMAILANVAVQDRIRKAGYDKPKTPTPEVADEVFYGT